MKMKKELVELFLEEIFFEDMELIELEEMRILEEVLFLALGVGFSRLVLDPDRLSEILGYTEKRLFTKMKKIAKKVQSSQVIADKIKHGFPIEGEPFMYFMLAEFMLDPDIHYTDELERIVCLNIGEYIHTSTVSSSSNLAALKFILDFVYDVNFGDLNWSLTRYIKMYPKGIITSKQVEKLLKNTSWYGDFEKTEELFKRTPGVFTPARVIYMIAESI